MKKLLFSRICKIEGCAKIVFGKGLCEKHYMKEYYKSNPNKDCRKKYFQKIKETIFNHYGHRCVCCNESRIEFLTIDHVNNDGKEHRISIGLSNNIYWWLIKNNFPPEPKLQVLCWNCQEAKAHYGYCPHQKEEDKIKEMKK